MLFECKVEDFNLWKVELELYNNTLFFLINNLFFFNFQYSILYEDEE